LNFNAQGGGARTGNRGNGRNGGDGKNSVLTVTTQRSFGLGYGGSGACDGGSGGGGTLLLLVVSAMHIRCLS
jgi:hypothetical protein